MSDDDAIRTTLIEAGDWAEGQALLPGPARARQRARTRSSLAVAGIAALTVVALLGAVLGVTGLSGAGLAGVQPASHGDPNSDGVPTTIPDDFDLGMAVPEGPDVKGGPADRLTVDVCPGEGIPRIDTAVDRRLAWRSGPEWGESRGLLVFADADAAVAFMGALRSVADRCAHGVPRPEGGSRVIVRGPLAGAWGEGVALLLVNLPVAGEAPIVGSYLLVARKGSAVILQHTGGEIYFTEIPATPPADAVQRERPPLDALAPRLCRWTVAGC